MKKAMTTARKPRTPRTPRRCRFCGHEGRAMVQEIFGASVDTACRDVDACGSRMRQASMNGQGRRPARCR